MRTWGAERGRGNAADTCDGAEVGDGPIGEGAVGDGPVDAATAPEGVEEAPGLRSIALAAAARRLGDITFGVGVNFIRSMETTAPADATTGRNNGVEGLGGGGSEGDADTAGVGG